MKRWCRMGRGLVADADAAVAMPTARAAARVAASEVSRPERSCSPAPRSGWSSRETAARSAPIVSSSCRWLGGVVGVSLPPVVVVVVVVSGFGGGGGGGVEEEDVRPSARCRPDGRCAAAAAAGDHPEVLLLGVVFREVVCDGEAGGNEEDAAPAGWRQRAAAAASCP